MAVKMMVAVEWLRITNHPMSVAVASAIKGQKRMVAKAGKLAAYRI